MTPKEKATELVQKFILYAYPFSAGSGYLTGELDAESQLKQAKEMSLITAHECLGACAFNDYKIKKEYIETTDADDCNFITYWDEVKQEIEKL